MRLLLLETSSETGAVALAVDGDVREREIATPREQTERMLPLVRELLAEAGMRVADLDAIVFGRGPGSFTGLRISAALAQGLALASGKPIAAVSSLQCLAQRAWRELEADRSLVCVDARMGETYSAFYAVDGGIARLVGEERLGAPGNVALPPEAAEHAWTGVGSGWAAYAEALAGIAPPAVRIAAGLKPTARDLLPGATQEVAAGELKTPDSALPVYLRNASAWHRRVR